MLPVVAVEVHAVDAGRKLSGMKKTVITAIVFITSDMRFEACSR